MVSAIGRKRRPAAMACWQLAALKPAILVSLGGIQSGISIHGPTSCCSKNCSLTQVKRASLSLARLQASSSSPSVSGVAGPVAL